MRRLLSLLFCLSFVVGLAKLFAYAAVVNKEDYHEINIVPAPKGVKIDGDLADWDRSGEVLLFADAAMANTFAVRGYMMYDDQAFYIGARVKDPTPMMNMYTAGSDYAMSWNADAQQIRLVTDRTIPKPYPTGDQRTNAGGKMWDNVLAHLTLWYSTTEKKACFYVCFGMNFDKGKLNPEGVEGAYRVDPDGQGYSMEYRIPWGVLLADRNRPVAGDVTGAQWQAHWGDVKGRQLARGLTDIRMPGGKMLGYMAPGEFGKAVFSPRGNLDLPRRVVEAGGAPEGHIPIVVETPGEAGARKKLSVAIRDAKGNLIRTLCGAWPVASGKVTVQWDGLDDLNQPVPPGQYTVQGLHHDGIKTAFVASVNNSGDPPYQTDDGKGSWGGDYGPPVSVAAEGDRVYALWPSGEAMTTHIAVDLEGKKQWGAMGNQSLGNSRAWTVKDGFLYQLGINGVLKMDAATGQHTPFTGGKSAVTPFKPSWSRHAIVAHGESLYVTVNPAWDKTQSNAVLVLDLKSGDLKKEIAVKIEPWGVAVSARGEFYICSADAIYRFNPASGACEAVVQGLDAARHLCCDPDGVIYVSLHGKTQQVHKYSPAGQLLASFGKPGGRPKLGRYDPSGVLNPEGIAVDKNGRLWVCENDDFPRRLSVWNKDATLYKEFFGSARYSAFGYADETRPEIVEEANVRWTVDLKTGKTAPYSTVLRDDPVPQEPNGWNKQLGFGHFIHRDGRVYLHVKGNGGYYKIFEEVNGVYQLRLAQMGARQKDKGGLFIDRNGDGRIADDEIRAQPVITDLYWSTQIAPNLDVYWPAPTGVYRWRLAKIEANGCLTYEDKPELIPCEGWSGACALAIGKDDAIYILSRQGEEIQRGEPMRGRGHFLGKWSPDGKLLWKYQNAWVSFAWNSGIYQPGELMAYVKFAGRPDKYVAVTGYYGQYFLLDAEQGLFVDALGQDQRDNYTMGANMVHTETFNGFLYQPRGQEDYYFLAGDADVRIWRLAGMKSVARFTQTVSVSDAQVAQARELLAERGRKRLREMLRPADAYATQTALVIDGDPRDWYKLTYGRPGAKIAAPAGRGGQVWLMHDAKNLYLLYEIQDDTPLMNDLKNPQLIFKTGDAVEFLFEPDPNADPKRRKPAKGDVRIIVARTLDGKMAATLFRPVSDNQTHKAHFESPTGKEDFDEVRAPDGVEMGFSARGKVYNVELAIPWSVLGMAAPQKGDRRRGDFGVIYGNPGGTRNAIKYLWADQSPEVSINNDVPSEVRLHPSEWGEIRFW